mgnify:CR=1 FL=1
MNKGSYLLFLCLLLALAVTGCNSADNEDNQKLEVKSSQVEVIDGDTIKIQWKQNGKIKKETVRLLLIDAPELNHPQWGEQPFGPEAKQYLEKLIESAKTITIEKDQTTRDKYNRFLAHVYADDTSIQESLLEKGYVRVAYVKQPNTKYLKEYQRAEKEAQEKGRGIWSIENYVQEDGFHPEVTVQSDDSTKGKFVASKNSDVYHPVGCSVVKTIKPKNRIYFQTEEEAKASGRKRSKVKECWD